MGKVTKVQIRKQIKLAEKKRIRRAKFVLVIGIARTGTNLCVSTLNQSSIFYLGNEINNIIIPSIPRTGKELTVPFPRKFNGNKICIFRGIEDWHVRRCISEKILIIPKNPYRSKDLKLVFTRRNPVSSVVSSFLRTAGKNKAMSVEQCVLIYIHGIKVIRSLQKCFKHYHVYDFDKALSGDLEARKLFTFCEEEYEDRFFSDFVSMDHYNYNSLHKKNVLTGKKEYHKKLIQEAKDIFESKGIDIKKLTI